MFNLAAYVLSAGKACPDKTALEILSADGVKNWSYRDLTQAVLGTACGLKKLGLPEGSIILLRIGNTVDFPILFLGAIAAGFVPVPTSSQLTEPETRAMIADLVPAIVVFGTGVQHLADLPCPTLAADDLAAVRQEPPAEFAYGHPDRLAYIIYTSGTSGTPRAVQHAHRAIWARRMMWDGWYGLTANDRLLHAGAFNWTYTLGTGLMDPWAIGATALIPDGSVDRTMLCRVLKDRHVSIFAAAPGVYRQILKSGELIDLPALRHGLSAGEKLPKSIRAEWLTTTDRPVFEALGMSEVSTFISSSPKHPADDSVSGFPQPGRRVAVLDEETSQPVACGTPGILAVSNRDQGLMLGYRNAAAETNARFVGEWFLTGDIVSMDANGGITYLGRNDDMMNAGGYRVSPIEVETVLNHHPDITESAAATVEIKPDTFVIAAFYVSDLDLAENTLSTYCQERLVAYKCPRLFVRLDDLPKGANNKLRRAELRKQSKGRT